MTPYYDDGTCTIYHGDCREVLPTVDEVAATITDPPYGTGSYANDDDVLNATMMTTLLPLPMAVFGWPEALVRLCCVAGMMPDEWITWWPTNGALRGTNMRGLWRESECIAVFGSHHFWRVVRPRTSAVKHYVGAGDRGTLSKGNPATRHESDVWTDAAPGLAFQSAQRLHPNEKPLGVMTRLVLGMTEPGDTVLDPFMGSGTTLRAAKDLGRKAIGIEVNEQHCETAARRLGQEVLPL